MQKLAADPNSFALFGYSNVSLNGGKIQAAKVEGEAWKPLLEKDILPHTRVGDLAKYGITSETLGAQGVSADTLFTLVDLATPDQATEYWIGLQNFYVITRYNRSSFYATSVMQLAEAIRAARAPRQAGNTPVER